MGALGRSGRGCHEPQAQPRCLSLLAPSPACPLPRGQGEGALSGHREVGTAQGSLQQTPRSRCQDPWGQGSRCQDWGCRGGPCGPGPDSGHMGCPPHTRDPWVCAPPMLSPLCRGARVVTGRSLGGAFLTRLTLPCRGPVGTRHGAALGRTGFVCAGAYGGGPGPRGSVWGPLESYPHGTQPPPLNSKGSVGLPPENV